MTCLNCDSAKEMLSNRSSGATKSLTPLPNEKNRTLRLLISEITFDYIIYEEMKFDCIHSLVTQEAFTVLIFQFCGYLSKTSIHVPFRPSR